MTKQKTNRRTERLNALKVEIRNVGIARLPSYEELGKKYECSDSQICLDLKQIITELDPHELDSVFTDFYQADLRALEILKTIMQQTTSSQADRIRAVQALVTLQKGATELLEAFTKKQKVADKVQVEQVSYNFEIKKPEDKPKEKLEVYDIVE